MLPSAPRKASVHPLNAPIRLAVDCLPDPSLVIEPDETIVHVNEAFETLSGYAGADVEGRRLADFLEPDGSNADPRSARCRTRGGFVAVRVSIRPMAGVLGPNLRLVRVEEGGEPGGAFVDRLGAGLELEGEFLARISHELRTPLTAVQEGLDIVVDGLTGPLNDNQREFLGLARRNVQRLTRLVNDTLEFGRLKRGERGVQYGPVDLRALARASADAQPEVAFECEADGEIWVTADPARVRDVIDKLVQNAIRHSPHAAVAVRVHAGALEAVLEVVDSGAGIPKDKLEEIFEEYEQLSVGPGRTVGGVGLGLTIAKLIIEQHGGRIWAESEPGRGSRFSFSLKLCKPPVEGIV
ncbi:MAG: PAS domain-containing sensor histidine kinase [Bryobacterales bacterium]|nr:PAS domain-containing sensor histidine kinase [Acidobacteriota bacterium]MCB9385633.1 PAS domain-containing sensor histidine kinase [Bryobacterales bacterium]